MKCNKSLVVSVFLFVAVLLAAGFSGYYTFYKQHIYHAEVLEPEVFDRVEYDTGLLLGLWQSGTVYYRYNEDGTGYTWDTADDVLEEEASFLEWNVEHSSFTHLHHMEVGGIIPKHYRIQELSLTHLVFTDDFGNTQTFKKVE